MPPEFIHAGALILVTALSFLLPKTSLASYDIQISAGLFLALFLGKRFAPASSAIKLAESLVFTFVILFVVNTTGGLASPFYFLLYFLLFSLSLLLEPMISITATVSLVVFFILSLPPNQEFRTLLPILSLAFLTPFALFMGREHVEIQEEKQKNATLQSAIATKTEETYLFLSLMLKNNLKSIMYHLDNFMGDHDLHVIRKQIRNMQHLIEKFEKGT